MRDLLACFNKKKKAQNANNIMMLKNDNRFGIFKTNQSQFIVLL